MSRRVGTAINFNDSVPGAMTHHTKSGLVTPLGDAARSDFPERNVSVYLKKQTSLSGRREVVAMNIPTRLSLGCFLGAARSLLKCAKRVQ